MSEDNSPWLGGYGDPLATTPRLDALAAESIRYTRAYSNAPVCAPSRAALITGAYPIAFGTEHMRSGYKTPQEIRFYPHYLREAGYYTTNNSKKDYNTVDQPEAWDESSREATYRNRAEDQPFFHIINFSTTHESRLHRGSVAANHDPAEVQLAPFHPDTPEARNDYAVYYDRLEELDGQVGEILDELEADGLADSTIVFYYSDHGGAVAGTKRFLTEGGLHVPLLIRVPERYGHLAGVELNGTVDRPVSFVDLPPTLLRLAGIEPPAHMAGTSVLRASDNKYVFAYGGRMDERRNLVRSVSDGQYRLTRNYLPHRPYGRRLEFLWRAPLMQSWVSEYEGGRLDAVQSSFFEPRTAVELYDIRNDPHETVNLALDMANTDKVRQLSAVLTDWQVEQRDAGLVPEAMLLKLDQQGVIRDYVTSDDYPVEDIVWLAQAASSRDPGYRDYFVEQLKSGHPVASYWAANGLLLLGKDAGGALSDIAQALDQVEPWTGVVLAELLIELDRALVAVPYLEKALQSENMMVRLQAMETIVETGLLDPALRPAIEAMVPEDPNDRPYDGRLARYVMQRYAVPGRPAQAGATFDRERILREADSYLALEPNPITRSSSQRSMGGIHDFYSEGDYWWPDPENPDGPYIRKDGQTNPGNFTDHRLAMRDLSRWVAALTAAYVLTGKEMYAERAILHLRTWFLDDATRMNPSLLYAQAIKGRVTGRGVGIIDTIHLIEVARSIQVLESKGVLGDTDLEGLKRWFEQYATWMTTHEYGIDEGNKVNNHGTWWAAQVAAFASLVGRDDLLVLSRKRFKELLSHQMDESGGFHEELRRTKPYNYSLFNLEGHAILAWYASTAGDDLWNYESGNGSLRQAIEFMLPFIADKSTWPYPPDVQHFDEIPIKSAFLLLAGRAYEDEDYLALWQGLPQDRLSNEVDRNFPIRQLILWDTNSDIQDRAR